MGKNEPSDEEIRKWLKNGWKFTKRTSKGHLYITRRLGSNIERSLGPFKQELWDRIQRLILESETPQKKEDPLSAFYGLVELNRAYLITHDCVHRNGEGFCTYWRWSPDYSFLRLREDLTLKEEQDEGGPVYLFRAHAKYCMNCTAYTSVKMKV